ncbi:alpha/beta hydrolase [Tanticharoenia sakaeratensis]|uniref:Inactive lipase n=1 Tax=Tanticharoenia sakaeratensis NBRC 103193 TaxID=1231623 RepID=A0A0D6MP75_9PROT|nr:lipase family protein [Tanticharoenia sakaeratensis]GAN55492.1 inactive lipase [Tanticharoenia sakaeratensis NBRC 103193]GBQ21918.1 hypothetical protein AA103193_1894 [Tanticharoenia sakaeratensis NBRC 103193]
MSVSRFLSVLALLGVSACASSPASHVPPVHARQASPRVAQLYGDGGVSDFYRAGIVMPKPGVLIRQEDMALAKLPPNTARGIRILYSSTSGVGTGTPVAVSGQVLIPDGPTPKGGWPVVAWEHGTTGIADVCAPSWRGYASRDRAYLGRWLKEGFAVVATDYQGLGTPGPHPYLLYRPEAYSALDAVRASLAAFGPLLRNRIVLVGQSQGSGAALGAAWVAPHYAPELHVRAVVATGLVAEFAIPAHPAHVPLPNVYTDPGQMDAAFAMLRVEGTDQSLHPETDDRVALTANGIAMSQVARTACLHDLFDYADRNHVDAKTLFGPGLKSYEETRTTAFLIPDGHIGMPVFAGTGLADGEAGVNGQYNAVAAMCDAGTNVVWKRYPGLTHNGTVNASLADSVPFVRAVLAGHHPENTCRAISRPGPVEAATPGIPWNR